MITRFREKTTGHNIYSEKTVFVKGCIRKYPITRANVTGSENFTPAHVQFAVFKDFFATSLRHFCEDVAVLLREEYVSSRSSLQAMHNKQVCGAVLTSCRGLLDTERGVQQSYQTGM